MSTIYSKINQQVEAMSKINQLALRLIKKGQDSQANKIENLFAPCSVCNGSSFLIIYQKGVRAAKRCPNAVWDESKKKHICQLNSVITGQLANKENQKDLLKTIRRIAFELSINPIMFLEAMKQFFQVGSLEELATKQLELILFKLKLAKEFKLKLIETNQIPQQPTTLRQVSKVA